MKSREIIYADKGKILTNGVEYGFEKLLAIGVNKSSYYEIPLEEYYKILEEEEKKRQEFLGGI